VEKYLAFKDAIAYEDAVKPAHDRPTWDAIHF
jgi:hypothetical protein